MDTPDRAMSFQLTLAFTSAALVAACGGAPVGTGGSGSPLAAVPPATLSPTDAAQASASTASPTTEEAVGTAGSNASSGAQSSGTGSVMAASGESSTDPTSTEASGTNAVGSMRAEAAFNPSQVASSGAVSASSVVSEGEGGSGEEEQTSVPGETPSNGVTAECGEPDVVWAESYLTLVNTGNEPLYFDWQSPWVQVEFERDGEMIVAYHRGDGVLSCSLAGQLDCCENANLSGLTSMTLMPCEYLSTLWEENLVVLDETTCAPCNCAAPIPPPTGPFTITLCMYRDMTCSDGSDACRGLANTGPNSDSVAVGVSECVTIETSEADITVGLPSGEILRTP